MFSGFVKCADCRRAMHKKTNAHPYATYHYYRCATARKMKKSACGNHTIRIDKLEEIVLVTIQQMIYTAIDMDKLLEKINACGSRKKESDHLKKAIKTQTTERDKCMRMMTELYPDLKSGLISQEEYLMLKQSMTEKIETLDKMIANLTETAKSYEEGVNGENEFIAHFKKYGKLKSLTRGILTELVEEILVHEDKKITIVFKFQNPYKEAMEYIEMNKDVIKTA